MNGFSMHGDGPTRANDWLEGEGECKFVLRFSTFPMALLFNVPRNPR